MEIDNRWIPGYNPALLMKYRCHINVEYCGSIKAINYLYKYIYKGTDQGYMKLKQFKEEMETNDHDVDYTEEKCVTSDVAI